MEFSRFRILAPVMWMIVGLGNPGKRYALTRHNIGFMVIDRMTQRLGLDPTRMDCQAQVSRTRLDGEAILLAQPRTYMNLSGNAVRCLSKKYRVPAQRVLVIIDEVALPLGKIRLRAKGSAGGHNGLGSVIDALQTTDLPRLRLGIGPTEGRPDDLVDFVLSDFTVRERPAVEFMIDHAEATIRSILRDGLEKSMSRCNSSAGYDLAEV